MPNGYAPPQVNSTHVRRGRLPLSSWPKPTLWAHLLQLCSLGLADKPLLDSSCSPSWLLLNSPSHLSNPSHGHFCPLFQLYTQNADILSL